MTLNSSAPFRIIVIDDTESIHQDFRKTLGSRSSSEAAAAQMLDQQEAALFGEQAPARVERTGEYEIDSALQGEEGCAMVRMAVVEDRPYAVAFVDMRMPPGWDGLETVEHLWHEDPTLQVVICTAYSDYSWTEIVHRLGVKDKLLILKKPFENIEVSQIAMALCQKWAMTNTARMKIEQMEALVDKRTAELRHAATHDQLTGLPNREHLVRRLRQTLARKGPARAYALLCLDFDRFKLVNDTLGHDVGDQLLQEIAQRLRAAIIDDPERALAARMGGDEYVILLDHLDEPRQAVELGEGLLDALRVPYHLGGHEVCSTASIGITTSEMNYAQPQDMLRHADVAMYRAKAMGRNSLAVFDRTMHDEVISRMEMEQTVRRAIHNDMLAVFYQPIVRVGDGRIIGFEALCRLKRSATEIIMPADFIPVAEEVGLIQEVGDFVLERSLQQLRQWQVSDADLRDLSVSVNVSKKQLVDPQISKRVTELLDRYEIDPSRLLLEITESTVMSSPDTFTERLAELKKTGVRFAMDDFGTGQSSLTLLHEFPIDVLKIDQAFMRSVTRNLEYAAIVQAIVTLADNLRIHVVIEGVETNPQLVLIQSLDCYGAQGFLFSQPRDADYWSEHLPDLVHSCHYAAA